MLGEASGADGHYFTMGETTARLCCKGEKTEDSEELRCRGREGVEVVARQVRSH